MAENRSRTGLYRQPDDAQRLREAAAKLVEEGVEEAFSYYAFPSEHWRSLRSNNPPERIVRKVRRGTRVVPDGIGALLLVAARLRHIAGKTWRTKRYMNMARLAAISVPVSPASAPQSV